MMRDDFEKDKQTEGSISDIAPSLQLDIPDDELVTNINKMIEESKDLFEKIRKVGEENEQYWDGKQLEEIKVRRLSARVNDNRLFLSAETIIPIMTSRTPEPTIRLKNPELREKVKQILMNLWEVPTDDDAAQDMQANFELLARHWMLYRLGVLKYYYDEEIDDIRTSVVRPNKIRVDKYGSTIDECRFIAEYCEDTVEGLVEKWPKKEKEILEAAGKDKIDNSKAIYVEFWTNEYCVYKFLNVILEKKKNPNFDYGDMSGRGYGAQIETGKIRQPGEKLKKGVFNLFRCPRKPYITLSVFSLGKTLYDDTSLFEQGRSLQDDVNKLKRNITENASDNGILGGSGDFIDKKVLENYSGAPDEKLWIKAGRIQDALFRLPPKEMPAYVMNNLQDNKKEIDNLFGTHDTTRGERDDPKTATEATMLRQGDMGRIDLFSRALDRVAQNWYSAMLQMKLVFTTEPKELTSNDEEGTTIIFDRNEFVNPETGNLYKIRIKVKAGSAMSIDKDERRAEAFQLMQAGLIDPITFFTRMDYSNPQEMAKTLFLWKTNPIALFPDLLAQQQQQQQAQQEQQMQQLLHTPLKEGTPINLPANSLQRPTPTPALGPS